MPNSAEETLAATQAVRKVVAFLGADAPADLIALTTPVAVNARFHFLDAGPFNINRLTSGSQRGTGCVLGFADRLHGQPELFIRRDLANPGTLVHELLHFCSSPVYEQYFSGSNHWVVEGITEYFTRRIYTIARQSYPRELAVITQVVTMLGGETELRAAMLRADPAALQEVAAAIPLVLGMGQPPVPTHAPSWNVSPRAGVPRNPRVTIGRRG